MKVLNQYQLDYFLYSVWKGTQKLGKFGVSSITTLFFFYKNKPYIFHLKLNVTLCAGVKQFREWYNL